MIDLSIDLSYLSRYYSIPIISPYIAQKTKAQEGEDGEMLTIITEDGAIRVNTELLQKLLQEPDKLAKILKLQDPANRYLIIKELNEEDLQSLLPFLSSEQLAMGLQYFSVAGLEKMMKALPSEQMVNLLLVHFTMEDVVPFMQENEMNKFFDSTNLKKKDVMEYFEGMQYQKFQKLMVNQFGYEFKDKTSKEYLDFIDQMEDKDFKRFLKNMKNEEKMEAIVGLCNINPDYYMEFENSVLVRPMINLLEKDEIIKAMSTLDPEFLVPMIEELPKEFIQIVATQIDPGDFADMLSSEFPDLIMEMLAG